MTELRAVRPSAGIQKSPYSRGISKRPTYEKQMVLYWRTQSHLYVAPSHYPARPIDSSFFVEVDPIGEVYRQLSGSAANEKHTSSRENDSVVISALVDVIPFALYAICTVWFLQMVSSLGQGDYGSAFADFMAVSILVPVALVSSKVRRDMSRSLSRKYTAHASNPN